MKSRKGLVGLVLGLTTTIILGTTTPVMGESYRKKFVDENYLSEEFRNPVSRVLDNSIKVRCHTYPVKYDDTAWDVAKRLCSPALHHKGISNYKFRNLFWPAFNKINCESLSDREGNKNGLLNDIRPSDELIIPPGFVLYEFINLEGQNKFRVHFVDRYEGFLYTQRFGKPLR